MRCHSLNKNKKSKSILIIFEIWNRSIWLITTFIYTTRLRCYNSELIAKLIQCICEWTLFIKFSIFKLSETLIRPYHYVNSIHLHCKLNLNIFLQHLVFLFKWSEHVRHWAKCIWLPESIYSMLSNFKLETHYRCLVIMYVAFGCSVSQMCE